MRGAAWHVIEACWISWVALWVVMAFFQKRTVERPDRLWSTGSAVALAAVFLVFRSGSIGSTRAAYGVSGAFANAGAALVIVGLCVTAWARFALGSNWSGSIVLKENHELIESGPYAFVRHPIYTGLLVMFLGTFLVEARPIGFLAFALACAVFWGKLRREERLMASHFPAAYADYRRRTKALIPFVL